MTSPLSPASRKRQGCTHEIAVCAYSTKAALPPDQQFYPVRCGMVAGCDAQHLMGLVQKDGCCLIAPARVIAMAAPVDRQHNTIGVERGEHSIRDCCDVT